MLYENLVMEIVHAVHEQDDVSSTLFETKEYISDFNLSVAAKYYGLEISYHIYVALSKMAATFNIGGALMTFSSRFAQRSAEKAGFKLIKELKFQDFRDKDGNIKLPVEQAESIKLMYAKYSVCGNPNNK